MTGIINSNDNSANNTTSFHRGNLPLKYYPKNTMMLLNSRNESESSTPFNIMVNKKPLGVNLAQTQKFKEKKQNLKSKRQKKSTLLPSSMHNSIDDNSRQNGLPSD